MEPFELDDAEWDEVLAVINAEASERGIAGDFINMSLLFKKLWKLITIKGQRQQQLVHAKHRDLKRLRDKQVENVSKIEEEISKLPPDPGPPRPPGPPGGGPPGQSKK